MNELQIFNASPFTKAEQAEFVRGAVAQIEGGEVNPLTADLHLKSLEEVIKAIRGEVQLLVIDEAEKHGKSFTMNGHTIEVKTRTTRDFTGCGDPVYNGLLDELESIKAQIKAREAMLLAGVNPETGEKYSPPKSSTSTFLTYKFK